jgi:hypothetical protein
MAGVYIQRLGLWDANDVYLDAREIHMKNSKKMLLESFRKNWKKYTHVYPMLIFICADFDIKNDHMWPTRKRENVISYFRKQYTTNIIVSFEHFVIFV